MGRHRTKVPRHNAQVRDGESPAAPVRVKGAGQAMRRVMVTPTFAAGLGVVIAAVLVYPMSRMVFSYGARCQVPGCGSGTATAPGTGASAQPGKQMGTGAGPAPQAPSPVTSPGSGKSPSGQPTLSYRTVSKADGSFTGQIVIDFRPRSVPARWQLWISYPAGRIVAVSGGTWQADSGHSGLIYGTGDNGSSSAGGKLKVGFTVQSTYPGAPPGGCTIDNKPCHFVSPDDTSAAGTVNDAGAWPMKLGRSRASAAHACNADDGGHRAGLCHRKAA
jgi:hypothetical protein